MLSVWSSAEHTVSPAELNIRLNFAFYPNEFSSFLQTTSSLSRCDIYLLKSLNLP